MSNVLAPTSLDSSTPVLTMSNEMYFSGTTWKKLSGAKESILTWFDKINQPPTTQINNIREVSDKYINCTDAAQRKIYKTQKRDLKEGLPVLFPSGVYEDGTTSPTKYTQSTNVIVIDIDIDIDKNTNTHLIGNFEPLIDAIRKDEIINSLMIGYHYSASNYGLAVYMYCDTAPTKEVFKETYLKYKTLFKGLGVDTDNSCSNINRARYSSSDLNAYLKKDFDSVNASELFKGLKLPVKRKKVIKTRTKSTAPKSKDWTNTEKLEACLSQLTEDVAGDYEDWIKVAFSLENEFGESGRGYFNDISSFYPGYDSEETNKQYDKAIQSNGAGITIASLFKVFADRNINFSEVLNGNQTNRANLNVSKGVKRENTIDKMPFTYLKDSKDGKSKSINVEPVKILEWLSAQGYSMAKINDVKSFVCINNNIIKIVEPLDIKHHVIRRAVKTELLHLSAVVRFIKNGYEGLFETLGYKEIPERKTTSNKSYLYYTNKVLEITKEGVKAIDYADFKGFIFDTQIIPREYVVNKEGGQFEDFTKKISLEPNFNAFKSALGYLMHEYKDPSKSYAVVLNDKHFSVSQVANGGRGKGLICEGVSHMIKPSFGIDGKMFNSRENRFAFQSYKQNSKVAFLTDCKPDFEFNDLNNIITNDMTVEKKNTPAQTVLKNNSPKFLIDSNYLIKGEGTTYERRISNLYLSDFFIKNDSFDYFGNNLFDEWTTAEWNKFDTFMSECVQYFIINGKVKQEESTENDRRLLGATNQTFYDYVLNEDLEEGLYADGRYYKTSIELERYKEKTGHTKLTLTAFTIMLKTYARYTGYEYESKRVTNNGIKTSCFFLTPKK